MSRQKLPKLIRAAVLRNLRQLLRDNRMLVFGLLPLVILTVLILYAPKRSVQIEARTLSANVTLTGEPQSWDMAGAAICVPSEDIRAPANPPCGAGETFQISVQDAVDWPRDQVLDLVWKPHELSVRLVTPNTFWPSNTVLRLSPEQARKNGALAFFGHLTVGREIGAGATGYVLDGNYSIYETGAIIGLFGLSADVTRQGRIRRGDQVRVVCKNGWWSRCSNPKADNGSGIYDALVAGSFSADHDGKAGFHVVAVSTEENNHLEVGYAGRDQALLVRPNWLHRAAASSGFLALSLLFSLWAPLIIPMIERRKKK